MFFNTPYYAFSFFFLLKGLFLDFLDLSLVSLLNNTLILIFLSKGFLNCIYPTYSSLIYDLMIFSAYLSGYMPIPCAIYFQSPMFSLLNKISAFCFTFTSDGMYINLRGFLSYGLKTISYPCSIMKFFGLEVEYSRDNGWLDGFLIWICLICFLPISDRMMSRL